MRRDRQWRKRGTFIPEETRNINKITCKVCGKRVYPKAEYVVRDKIVSGGINAALMVVRAKMIYMMLWTARNVGARWC